jgi:hypothetical protein
MLLVVLIKKISGSMGASRMHGAVPLERRHPMKKKQGQRAFQKKNSLRKGLVKNAEW